MYFNKHSYKFSKKKEIIKWYLCFIILFIPILIKYVFQDWRFIFHLFIFIICFQLSILIAVSTKKGQELLYFLYQSKNEIKNIIWPNRKETTYTTFIVITIITFMSLILWGLDNVLFHAISFITTLRL